MKKNLILGISIGDINGIGLEVILKTFSDKRMLDLCTPVIFGSTKLIQDYKKSMSLNSFISHSITNISQLKNKKINVFECWNENVNLAIGQNNSDGGKYAFKSLEKASQHLLENNIDGLVTAPINKKNIQSKSFNFPGHTEYLASLKKENVLMIMATQNLKIGVITSHIPLENVAKNIDERQILSTINLFQKSLTKDFGVRRPRIAILGLNPHAGDEGLLGTQEKEIIIPTLEKAKENGFLVYGPYPADSFFGSDIFSKFDGVLAMYHDQGLIPFKTISFGQGVNYSAGLSFVRTSPDHGTAYDIAGKNMGNESSFRSAVYMACDIIRKRAEYQQINANTLPISKKQKVNSRK